MRSIKFVKELYGNAENMPDDSFFIKDFDLAYEKRDTLSMLESAIHSELPFDGIQTTNDESIQRSLTIKFNNDAEFNATRCAVIYNDGDCDDFIVSNLLETFWKNLDIPDGIAPENYADDFWLYDLEFEIGNCIVYIENGEFESSYEDENGEKVPVKTNKKTIGVLPYKVSFSKREEEVPFGM